MTAAEGGVSSRAADAGRCVRKTFCRIVIVSQVYGLLSVGIGAGQADFRVLPVPQWCRWEDATYYIPGGIETDHPPGGVRGPSRVGHRTSV